MRHIKFISHIFIIIFSLSVYSCAFDSGFEKYIIKDISQPYDILLYASDTTNIPSNVTIHIVGIIKGECMFEIENGLTRYETIKLKDTIDYYYNNEWYDSKINLRYILIQGIIGDSIVITYQIL